MGEFHKVERFIEKVCEEYGLMNNYYSNILMSVNAAFENAVKHGNKNCEDKNVTLTFANPSSGLMFKIEDEGEGFDTEAIQDPFENINESENAGKGIYLMRTLTDEIEFDDNGKSVSMLFKIGTINQGVTEERSQELMGYLQTEVKKQFMS